MDKKELWGSRLELIGLIALLIGSFWQAKLSGWWDQQLPEWQSLIQEKVNLAVLLSLENIASIETSNDDNFKRTLSQKVHERVDRAVTESIAEKNKRHDAMEKGQAATFWNIRDLLLILGASLIIIGKWLNLQGVKARTL